ncbi:MAG: ribonuclease H-like domain-containing protein, partial [Dehalococcoidia bacterium]|nr:ribonuclease H-like domain-containing protein [Dehalococcoidia bacterium]
LLKGVGTIYTYNGSRFDLPFIHTSLKLDLADYHQHHDLMYDCWKVGLRGGLKSVEQQLGIQRMLTGVDGLEAIRLWYSYQNDDDDYALRTLLRYNEEDVINLKILREKLNSI